MSGRQPPYRVSVCALAIVVVATLPIRLAAQVQPAVPPVEAPAPLTPPVPGSSGPEAPAPAPGPVELWSAPAPPPLFGISSLDFSFDCVGCGAGHAAESPPPNPNAPWIVQGAARATNRLGTFSAGVVGVRNYSPPLYTLAFPGQEFRPPAGSISQTDMAVRETQWHVTAGFMRRLWTQANGASLDLTTDVLLPVRTGVTPADVTRITPLPSRAVRVGAIVRW